jgi:hypothetical protein
LRPDLVPQQFDMAVPIRRSYFLFDQWSIFLSATKRVVLPALQVKRCRSSVTRAHHAAAPPRLSQSGEKNGRTRVQTGRRGADLRGRDRDRGGVN